MESLPRHARFRRFEVVTTNKLNTRDHVAARKGTIIWCDPPNRKLPNGLWMPWQYIVSFDQVNYGSFAEYDLLPAGEHDLEQNHLGNRYEISYDTVTNEDMIFVEGTFRTPGNFWGIFAFGNESISETRFERNNTLRSIDCLAVSVPENININHLFISETMSKFFHAPSWIVIKGPSSMLLR